MYKILLISVLFLTFPASAGEVTLENFQLWSTTYGNDVIRVLPVGATVIADGCTDPDSYMVKTSLPEAVKARIYSTLLAAKMAGKTVKITTSACEDNRPAINNVILE
ncbi:hypothetical protein KFE80_08895 [bacterium SCSIO 12696]|nr:hypothetical protein KFE80_08895 [bacterium SCSIO 12696]